MNQKAIAMRKLYFILSILAITSLRTGCAGIAAVQAAEVKSTAAPNVVSSTPPANCPLTVPQDPPFTPPASYSDLGFKGYFWYGSDSLWVALPQNGVWQGLPQNPGGYTQKVPWWREGYSWNAEPEPPLIVTGERLDAPAPPLNASKANGSYAPDMGSAMMTAVDLPTPGCWKVTGQYRDAELSFVVWVAP